MADESRIEELESRVEELESELAAYREQHAFLLAKADVDFLDDPACPECGDGRLQKKTGLSWAKAVCDECGANWVL